MSTTHHLRRNTDFVASVEAETTRQIERALVPLLIARQAAGVTGPITTAEQVEAATTAVRVTADLLAAESGFPRVDVEWLVWDIVTGDVAR